MSRGPIAATLIRSMATSACMASLMLGGCQSEITHKIGAVLFDTTEKPAIPTRRVRRDLLQEVADLKEKLAAAQRTGGDGDSSAAEPPRPIEQAKTWDEAAALLPKDSDGNVDWVKASKDGVIAPKAGPSRNSPQHALVSFDVTLVPDSGEGFKSVFSHEVHTALLACSSCHPSSFQMKAGADVISMDKINAGESCGVCHGTVAFAATLCARCHPAM